MFTMEQNGYNKNEVDKVINELNKINSGLIKALSKSRDIESSSRNLFNLKMQKLMVIYKALDNAFNRLFERYPQIANISDIKEDFEDFAYDFKNILGDDFENASINEPVNTNNDTIRLLLKKMESYAVKPKDNTDIKQASIQRKNNQITESGFDLKEAIQPTMDLAEIMKLIEEGK